MLYGGETDAENLWELYSFPSIKKPTKPAKGVTVTDSIDAKALLERMEKGESVVIFGAGPFPSSGISYQLSVAGRTNGHLATVIKDHPLVEDLFAEGYCSRMFASMMEGASAAILDIGRIAHDPIIDIATSYKNAKREALLFEYKVGKGKLLVCTLKLKECDPGALWLRDRIMQYANSEIFEPADRISYAELLEMCGVESVSDEGNQNEAQNKNDITMK
jgi:hypothetical protein